MKDLIDIVKTLTTREIFEGIGFAALLIVMYFALWLGGCIYNIA